jgi:hypothetical protein
MLTKFKDNEDSLKGISNNQLTKNNEIEVSEEYEEEYDEECEHSIKSTKSNIRNFYNIMMQSSTSAKSKKKCLKKSNTLEAIKEQDSNKCSHLVRSAKSYNEHDSPKTQSANPK